MIKKYKKYTSICFFIFLLTILSYFLIINYEKFTLDKEFEEKMDAYIINLDTRPDRFQQLTSHFFDKFNLIRISAVNMNSELKKTYYNDIKLSNGQLGCALSHMKILNLAKQRGLKTVLTMEDDCKPSENFSSWPKVKEWLDNNLDKWDIYNGGTVAYNYVDKKTIKPICKINNDIQFYKTYSMSSQFWYINSKCFDKLLSWENKKSAVIDEFPMDLKLEVITSTPFITTQETGLSDISNSISDTTNDFTRSEDTFKRVKNNNSC